MAERLKFRLLTEEEVEAWKNPCGATKSKEKKRGKIKCELTPGHIDPVHLGRDKAGRWHSWLVQKPSAPTVSG